MDGYLTDEQVQHIEKLIESGADVCVWIFQADLCGHLDGREGRGGKILSNGYERIARIVHSDSPGCMICFHNGKWMLASAIPAKNVILPREVFGPHWKELVAIADQVAEAKTSLKNLAESLNPTEPPQNKE